MKKIIAVLLTLVMAFSMTYITPVEAETFKYQMQLGKQYSGKLEGSVLYYMKVYDYAEYNFTVSKATNIKVEVKYSGDSCSYNLKSGSSYYSTDSKGAAYLQPGSYTLEIKGYAATYTAKVSDIGVGSVKFNKSSATLKEGTRIPFTYTCSYEQARKDISITNSKQKVSTASLSVNSDGTGYVYMSPKFIGKTVVTLKLKGGNTSKFTAYLRNGFWFVAKGNKSKMPKPVGFKKLKWKSSKKKVVTINKKTGKIKAKKGGRVTITAKKGKQKFTIKLVVTDYIKLAKKTYREIRDTVNNPDKLKIYNVYKGYSKQIYTNGAKIPVVMIDFGSTNDFGAMTRKKIMAYYDEVHEARFISVSNANNIISKKSIKKSKIK